MSKSPVASSIGCCAKCYGSGRGNTDVMTRMVLPVAMTCHSFVHRCHSSSSISSSSSSSSSSSEARLPKQNKKQKNWTVFLHRFVGNYNFFHIVFFFLFQSALYTEATMIGPPLVPEEGVGPAGWAELPPLPAGGACVAEGVAWRQRHVTGSATRSSDILAWTLKVFSQ